MISPPPTSTLFPYTTLFRSSQLTITMIGGPTALIEVGGFRLLTDPTFDAPGEYRLSYTTLRKTSRPALTGRSEEHTSELQSRQYLVCRLLLEKKKKIRMTT